MPPPDGLAARLVVGPALRTQPDRRLVALVRDGYELAFEEIVRRYGKPLARYAGAIVGNHADDVTQDALSKALLALRRDGAEIELRPWLFRIVRNTALNDLRDRPPSAEALAGEIAGGRNPAEELERREELTDLMRRLQSLPEPQRAAIVMRELEGLSHEEIAAALGLSGGGARQAIYRARQALREGMGMLLPLPLLRHLIDHGSDAAAASAASGGAAAASGAIGGAGAGMALKASVVTAVLAGSVGAGVALHDRDHAGDGASAAQAPGVTTRTVARSAPLPSAAADPGVTPESADRAGSSHGGPDHGSGGSSSGPDDSGHDRGTPRHGSSPGGGPGPPPPVDEPHGHKGPEDSGHGGQQGDREEGEGSDSHSGPGGGSGGDRGSGEQRHGGGQGSGGGSGSGSGGGGRHDSDGDGPGSTEPAPPPPPPEEGIHGGEDGSGSGSEGSGHGPSEDPGRIDELP
jgi:RNA polymerase sigma factor (sigma-70 family)